MTNTPTRKNEVFGNEKQVNDAPAVTGALNFEIPIIDVALPSNGKVYPEGHPLYQQRDITITSMTAAQENILTNRTLAKRGTLLTHLIQSCLRDKTISAKSMLIGDRNTVMVALRISGYGPDYSVKMSCPACDQTSDQMFGLDKLPVNRLEIEPVHVGQNLFETKLPQTSAVVRFKFLTGADEEEIAQTQAQKKKLGAGVADSEMITSGLLSAIVSINGVTDRAQINAAIPKLPAYDSRVLRKYIQENEPGIQMKGEFQCSHCDYAQEVDMPLGASFFWPDAA